MTLESSAPIVEASSEDIEKIVTKIEAVVADERRDHTIIALMAFAIFLANPQIKPGELVQGVERVSGVVAEIALAADATVATDSKQVVLAN